MISPVANGPAEELGPEGLQEASIGGLQAAHTHALHTHLQLGLPYRGTLVALGHQLAVVLQIGHHQPASGSGVIRSP